MLLGSAQRFALAGSSNYRANAQNDPAADQDRVLATLKERQQKRPLETEAQRDAEEQRPFAKPRAAQRRNKRTAGTTSGSVEQPASERKELCLTAERFAAGACDPSESGAASSGSAVQPTQMQLQEQKMRRLLHEHQKLPGDGWFVDNADTKLQSIILEARDLQHIPATQEFLSKQAIRVLYAPICGALTPSHGYEQSPKFYSHDLKRKIPN